MARPVVGGDDPGMIGPGLDYSNLVLTQLWLSLAAAWFCWRLWAGVNRLVGGPVELCLIVVVVLTALSATFVAPYKHPAYLISWEWLGFLGALFSVRQLAVAARAQHGLLSALLATAVSTAALGCFQSLVDLPLLAANVSVPDQALANPWQEFLRLQVLDRLASSTFSDSAAFASFLILLLPALVASFFAGTARERPVFVGACLGLFALIGLLALYLTRSESAWISLAVAVGILSLGIGCYWFRRRLVPFAIGVVILLGGFYLLYLNGVTPYTPGKELARTAQQCREAWRGTIHLIAAHPFLGVGPGNFSREYPQQMSASDGDRFRDPHDFVLEVAATTGVPAAVALACAVGFFFIVLARKPRESDCTDPELASAPQSPASKRKIPVQIHWEFYVGGMLGLLLGLVLRLGSSRAPEAIMKEGLAALARSVVWFLAFAIFERNVWTPRACALALAAGVGAVVLHLLVSAGIGIPGVAALLWVVIGLALNLQSALPASWLSRQRALLAMVVPVALCAPVFCFLLALAPVANAAGIFRQAEKNGSEYFVDRARKPRDREITNYTHYLNLRVIGLLKQANREDPGNARILNRLAYWYGQLWLLDWANDDLAKRAVSQAVVARQFDPHGPDSYLVELDLRILFARRLTQNLSLLTPGLVLGLPYEMWLQSVEKTQPAFIDREKHAREQWTLAAEVMEQLAHFEHSDAPLQYQLAEAWFLAEEPEKMLLHAQLARKLDRLATVPWRHLADPQREQIHHWLRSNPDA